MSEHRAKTPNEIADTVAIDMQKALINGRLEGLSVGEHYRRVAAAAIELDRAQRAEANASVVKELRRRAGLPKTAPERAFLVGIRHLLTQATDAIEGEGE